MIDIFHKVKDKEKDAVLLLIGVGELMETVKEKVNNLHLAKRCDFFMEHRMRWNECIRQWMCF